MSKTKAEEIYADIINLPHHEITSRQRMSQINRAASFSPFAALTGYDDAVKETARLTSKRIEIDDGTKEVLNDNLRIAVEKADEQPEVSITYFLPDKKKSGGAYVTVTAVIKRIDEYERQIVLADKSTIPLGDLYEIESDIYNGIY